MASGTLLGALANAIAAHIVAHPNSGMGFASPGPHVNEGGPLPAHGNIGHGFGHGVNQGGHPGDHMGGHGFGHGVNHPAAHGMGGGFGLDHPVPGTVPAGTAGGYLVPQGAAKFGGQTFADYNDYRAADAVRTGPEQGLGGHGIPIPHVAAGAAGNYVVPNNAPWGAGIAFPSYQAYLDAYQQRFGHRGGPLSGGPAGQDPMGGFHRWGGQ